MKILFICQHNVFRSQVAEAYFNQINKTEHTCTSGGIFSGIQIPKEVMEYAKTEGVEIKGIPKGITTKQLRKTDLIIFVTEDYKEIVSKTIFKGKIEVWNICDYPIKPRDEIIKQIKLKVEDLVKRI